MSAGFMGDARNRRVLRLLWAGEREWLWRLGCVSSLVWDSEEC